jgi:FixJ family two-component response regulator
MPTSALLHSDTADSIWLAGLSVKDVPVISIVDDDRSVRESTGALVRSLGYRAEEFDSAEAFLASGRLSRTRCLIADLQMPGMDGLALQRRLIADGVRLPVIFMTAFPESKIHARAMAAGALGFLSKPFDEDRLIEYIDTALTLRSS